MCSVRKSWNGGQAFKIETVTSKSTFEDLTVILFLECMVEEEGKGRVDTNLGPDYAGFVNLVIKVFLREKLQK